MMQLIDSVDGKELVLETIQLCEPESNVRLWFKSEDGKRGTTVVIPVKKMPGVVVNSMDEQVRT